MTSTDSQSHAALRALLHDAAAAPADAARRLADEREALAGNGPLAHELLAAEMRWLDAQQAALGVAIPEFPAARREWLALRVRGLVGRPPDAAVVCDLAEVQAAAVAGGEGAIAGQCAAALAAATPRVAAGPAVDQEVAERFALLSTAIDDLPLAHQVGLLACTGRAVQAMAATVGSKPCRRLARRLRRAADDRELARRLEARIGRAGVARIETTNFVLLLVVLATLLVEATVALSPAQTHVLHWIDAGACTFFVADFLFELWLHPSRWSWFLRNALTDLVPAVPSVFFLLPGVEVPGGVESALLLRTLRLLRVTWAARYVQALRPLLRSARLLLFLVRGLDGLVARFSQLLNREFVFVPAAADVGRTAVEEDRRDLLFDALRREHELAGMLPADQRDALLRSRARAAFAATQRLPADGAARRVIGAEARDVPIGEAIEFLWALRPQDVGRWLRPADVQSLDRVIRVLSAPAVRWLPIVRRVAVHPLPALPEERIVGLARRVAEWVDGWHGRMLFLADLHGIVTGPQLLDRVATAMVKTSQRPAVRLLLFGGLFSITSVFWEDNCLSKIVGLPLVVLGSICLVFLVVGHWLKRLAGQAAESYRLTAEAHFLSQLERIKPRYEPQDLPFLAARVFGNDREAAAGLRMLRAQVRSQRTGVPIEDETVAPQVRQMANRVSLLYLHFLDGAPLHQSDVKATEQLLANQSLENLRQRFLAIDQRERKRLRRLRLDNGTILAGPYLWFSFITESIAVEAAKRIAGYNRYCIPLAERAMASPRALAAMDGWLQRRADPRGGRTLRERAPSSACAYPTAEFTALDFVGGDPERDHHLASLFGDDVLAVVQKDRRTMVREIFGTRPVHALPKHERSFNPLRFHQRRLAGGRVLLLPLLMGWRLARSLVWLVGRVRQIVREVFDPELAMQRREIGEAPFAVALRKIHRMRAPGLLEAIRMRLQLDPVYAGAPPGWTAGEGFAAEAPFERDVRFLHLREKEAVGLRDLAAAVRTRVTTLHAALPWLPDLGEGADAEARAAGELAVTSAWIADQDGARTLLFAERWRTETLPLLVRQGVRLSRTARIWRAVGSWFTVSPIELWLQRHGRGLARAEASALREAWARDLHGARAIVARQAALPAGTSPAEAAITTLRAAFADGAAVRRDLMVLRAVQSLAVLDIRNYRDLVFDLGQYAADGEEVGRSTELP